MSGNEQNISSVTAALTFKVPQKVGWSVQQGDRSWTGSNLQELIECVATERRSQAITLSLSLIFELPGNDGTVRS